MRNFAEKNGGSNVLASNEVLLAPEVVHMEIRYFNGSEISDSWDMREQKSLPLAVEIRIWLRSPNATNEPVMETYDASTLADSTREYRQVAYLPMAQIANGAQSSSTADSSTTTSTSSSDSGNDSSSGSASAFGNE
jgi:hypothetical protein